ncbi:MAG: class I SAM-dependent methyltransferase [Pseudomonadota bacterium]
MSRRSDHVLRYSVHSRLREHHLRRLLPRPAGGLLLDSGCGLGYLSEVLGRGYTRVGLDQELSSLLLNRRRGQDRMVRGSLCHLPFRDASFDLALCSEVLEHMPQGLDRQALAELARVLKPGGRLLVTVPALEGLRARSRLRNLGHDDPNGGEYHHRQGYHLQQLKDLARGLDLRLASRRYSMVLASELFMDLSKLVFLGKKGLSEHSQVDSARDKPVFKVYRKVFPLLHACFVCEDWLLSRLLRGHIHILAFDKTAPGGPS